MEDKVKTILIIDDEEGILSALKRLLRREDYNVITTTSPDRGLEILRNEPVSLIISDQRMPEMDGTEFLHQASMLQPDALRIMLTGYADVNAAMAAINQGQVYRFITKPWNDLELKVTIKEAVDFNNLRRENQKLYDLTIQQNAELKELNENLERKVEERTQEIAEKNEELNRLYKELQASYFKTIRVFLDLMEMYDPDLGGHAKRVGVSSRLLAEHCNLQEEELDVIEAAGYLHDVGLIGIPREIIRKRRLDRTLAEEGLFKQHPILGYVLLNAVPKLDQVSVLVRSHHELFNGTGYPDGLKKEEIPFGARIIAIANVYDHILARKNTSIDDVSIHLRKVAGVELDPLIVSKAIEVFLELKEVERPEVAIAVEDLRPNMVLARGLKTQSGRLLMPKDAVVKEVYLEKINKFHEIDPIEWIYVYKY